MSDAVESSLRPGIANQAAQIPGNGASDGALPIGSVDSIEKDVSSLLRPNIGPFEVADLPAARDMAVKIRTNEVVHVVFDPEDKSDDKNAFTLSVKRAIGKAVDEGTFDPVVSSNTPAFQAIKVRKAELYQQILLQFVFSEFADKGIPSDSRLLRSRDRIAFVFDIESNDARYDEILRNLTTARDRGGDFALTQDQRRAALLRLVTPPSDDVQAPPPGAMITPSPSRSIVDDLAVVLSRQSGRRLIIPLQYVRTFRPGDIRLENGDRIQIVPFPQFPSATESDGTTPGAVAVTSWFASEGLGVEIPGGSRTTLYDLLREFEETASDTVILRRPSELSGIDEFIMPTADALRLSNIPLRDLDLIHLDAFGLNPLIRGGSPAGANGQCPQCGLPRSGGAGKCANPLAGADQQLKQFTGVSVSDAAQQSGRAFQNVAAGFPTPFR